MKPTIVLFTFRINGLRCRLALRFARMVTFGMFDFKFDWPLILKVVHFDVTDFVAHIRDEIVTAVVEEQVEQSVVDALAEEDNRDVVMPDPEPAPIIDIRQNAGY